MALNWAMLDQQRSPIPLLNEITILTIDDGAEITLIIPNTPPSEGSSGEGVGGEKKLKETGRIYLTDQRLIFIASPNPTFETLTVPLASILSTSFEQPVFGTNYLSIDIKPSPDGGLASGTRAEIRFKDRGMFQFVSTLEKSRERAIYMKRQAASDEDTLRMSSMIYPMAIFTDLIRADNSIIRLPQR
ncbi:uncharacterized protein FOMMEDRAFT_89738 [Fomitiporia mediterranea MF3/22]|uniref:uncharacterized protein n=1 Tax=Fomitiporia mediterranea (strain MF3/22) TaxID=694068 RepID=UPI0004409793|nr:uncharacterized protein FOMMEDRAFT_89738 [Fomitiporia mediterranea MF3/22]EJD01682.1 hypothetical protein FOMMEDRAFT_89738 [Fomitiporia mediterranea MF3/22]